MKSSRFLRAFALALVLLSGCNRSAHSDEERIAEQVFNALAAKDWPAYEAAVTNQYTLLAKLQSASGSASKERFAGSAFAPDELKRLKADFVRATTAGGIDFRQERFVGLTYIGELEGSPLSEYGELKIVPKKYAFVTDTKDRKGALRPPYIILGRVRDFAHAFGLVFPNDDKAEEVDQGEDEASASTTEDEATSDEEVVEE